MKPTLVIMAAGMGSRFGGLKQLEGFGPNGETILEYSIYDGILAGFDKVVFVIKKEIEEIFKEKIGNKISEKIKTEYVFQELTSFNSNEKILNIRKKPFGTGHAILCCKDVVNTPFLVINADDFYGRESFKSAGDFLLAEVSERNYAMVGFNVENTLTENGSVARGVCKTTEDNFLISVEERTNIFKKENSIVFEENGEVIEIREGTRVSMNMWALHPSIFKVLETKFNEFLVSLDESTYEKKEFYIPKVIDDMVKDREVSVKVLNTSSKWYGITYKEDKESFIRDVSKIIEKDYPVII